ncbi:MAG TPA: DUF6611 family protein [Lacisediminihabitans sp.]|uniref:DUF6611 family protein n=1 Tax=Lacisediminihabitans sp. TaxID=2787631 RepID=UPI002ED7F31F
MHNSTLPPSVRVERLLVHWTRVALDGEHSWGDLQVGPVDRSGSVMRYRLTVYPPGITVVERRALVFRRRWPGVGLVLGLVVAIGLNVAINGWLALAVAAALFVVILLVSRSATAGIRPRVLRLRATVVATTGHREVLGELAPLTRAAAALLELDDRADHGLLTPVEHEHLWGEVYTGLSQTIYERRSVR